MVAVYSASTSNAVAEEDMLIIYITTLKVCLLKFKIITVSQLGGRLNFSDVITVV